MFRTIKSDKGKILIDTNELKSLLGCGRATAIIIGCAAGAKIRINRRVLWKVDIVESYLNQIAE